ncbi:MAG: carboxymuconolactone decarboxylase family protein [Rhodospirillales bacterium]|nr:MAG: carboxymuconolactone decarboxylase family protein [Rhodospirillales bacterium]
MPITNLEKELAAVGISIAAGCKPCTDFHIKAVREAGAEAPAVRDAVDQAAAVRAAANGIMYSYGLAHLGNEVSALPARVDPKRQAVLTGLGAAFAVNCTSTLDQHIAAAGEAGVSTGEIVEIASLARFIKGKGASHVDKRIEALEKESEAEPAAACCGA